MAAVFKRYDLVSRLGIPRLARAGFASSADELLIKRSETPCEGASELGPQSENDEVNPDFVNRNPRNLEKMNLARKSKGWGLDFPTREYWYKVFLEKGKRHTTAYVRHHTGVNVVRASTTEWAIQKFLYSNTDVSAVENIGRVLARRSLESGILHVLVQFTPDEEKSDKVILFRKALQEGGLLLEEPRRLYPLRPWD